MELIQKVSLGSIKSFPIDLKDIMESPYVYEPIIVDTQELKDYLLGSALVWGVRLQVLLDGVDENTTGLTPCHIAALPE
jgi:hypothetical protein